MLIYSVKNFNSHASCEALRLLYSIGFLLVAFQLTRLMRGVTI